MKNGIPFPFPLEQEDIACKRKTILTNLLASDEEFGQVPVQGISAESLEYLLDAYNTSFLDGYLKRMPIRVILSSRLTSCAGKFVFVRGLFGRVKQAEIRLSSDYLFRLARGPFELNGLAVSTPQEAFLLVFEHELCHAAEMMLYGKTGHSQRFLALANGLFGHTKTRHKLPTRRQEAAQDGLHIGSTVSFSYKNQELSGVISYIGKKATVMVSSSDGEYRDKRGRRYTKYRVSLSHIKQK